MKHKRNGKNGNTSHRTHAVRLEFKHPTAAAVAVAGTFNEWRPETTPMVEVGEGRWLKELVLPPGRYEYLLVADGQWLPDPLIPETVPNPFGGVNSVIHVPDGSSNKAGRAPPDSRAE
jgi:1,4-alpha-glucan branching enzyme